VTNFNLQRQAIVDEAISWLGTPYHHRARVKGSGVDCAQLPIAVYSKIGIIPEFDPGDYSTQWYLHRDAERYLEQVEKYAHETDGEILPGDFLVYKFGWTFSHGVIVVKWPIVIHAWGPSKKVCYGDGTRGQLAFMKNRKSRPVKHYTF
jgi:cell wall-associated NlpC family hydrolase